MKLLTLTVSGLAILQGVLSQTTTLDILPVSPGESVGELQGKLLGSGADGTTFEVFGTVSGVLVTETLVKGATYVSELVAISTEGAEGEVRRQCGYDDQNVAVCTAIVEVDAGGTQGAVTAASTATISFAPVAVDISASSASALSCLTAFIAIVPFVGFLVAL